MRTLSCAALCRDSRSVFARLAMHKLHNSRRVMQWRRHDKHVGQFVKRAIENRRAFALKPIMRGCIPRHAAEFLKGDCDFHLPQRRRPMLLEKRDERRQSSCKRCLAVLTVWSQKKSAAYFAQAKKTRAVARMRVSGAGTDGGARIAQPRSRIAPDWGQ